VYVLRDDITVQVTLFSTLYFLLRSQRFLIVFHFFEQCAALGFTGRWLNFSPVFVHSVCEIKTGVIS
jgi:hypothetical protein